MSYEGPHHVRITRKLRRIAKEHGLKLWFVPSLGAGGEYCVGEDRAVVLLDHTAAQLISIFFHELGHHVDYHAGLYPSYYRDTPLYRQRRIALRAERHADAVGKKLCRKYFPKVKYQKSYHTEDDIDFLNEGIADGRRKSILRDLIKQARNQ